MVAHSETCEVSLFTTGVRNAVEANECVSETILSAVKELDIIVPNECVSETTVGTW